MRKTVIINAGFLPLLQSGSTNFGEKFSRVKFSPSLTLFGGKPMEGWLAVTVSGLVTVSLLKPSGALLTASESLCRLRGRVALADIAFTGGGNIVVAATDGSSSSPVQFYKVCVSVVNEKCRIDTELLPSLFMRCTTDPVRRDKYPAVTHLKFLTRENSEQVRAAGTPSAKKWPPLLTTDYFIVITRFNQCNIYSYLKQINHR